jgi:hypothetical protein
MNQIQLEFNNLHHLSELYISGHEYAFVKIANCCRKRTFPKYLKVFHFTSEAKIDDACHEDIFDFTQELVSYCRQLRSLELKVDLLRDGIRLIKIIRNALELNSLLLPVTEISPQFFDEIGKMLCVAHFLQKIEFSLVSRFKVDVKLTLG